MSVHVEQMISDVQVEPDEKPGPDQEPAWDVRERVRATMERLRRDALRTECRGYDD